MIGFVYGDSNVAAARTAINGPLRIAVELPDTDRMLTLVIDDGEITGTWSALRGPIDRITAFATSVDELEAAMVETEVPPPALRLVR